MRVLIAGAGIGGLTTALALHARGHDVRVFEAVREVKPLGVGINLLPHAVQVLSGLGLVDALAAKAVATRELAYFNKHGQRIWSEPRGVAAGYDVPQLSLHRGVLQTTLLEQATARFAVVTDRRLLHVGEATATFEARDGARFDEGADVIIAADGIHSAARAQFFPKEGPPCFSGRALWRGTTRAEPFLGGATMIMAGHQDQKFVAYPIEPARDGTQRINWIAELRRDEPLERESWNKPGVLADFAPSFGSWRFDWLDVPGLIRAADAVFEFPMVDRDPLPKWRHGRVTLLGDAAHPMYPIGSNGASQAILDARALADAFDAHADVVDALDVYEALRRPATAAIVHANRSNGPEQCMQWAEERAPNGFTNIDDVIPRAELEALAARYKRVAGFEPAQLKKR